ncbi:MAG: RecBCD enzyme subunit RecD, partial [Fibrobacterota bacterium]
MTSWQTWLCAWQGASSFALEEPIVLPSAPCDLLALGLFVEGLADAATLRQARLLAMGDADLRLLLLLLLARLRQGQPRSDLVDLTDLVKSSGNDPGFGWDGLDAPALHRARIACAPDICRNLSRIVEGLAADPSRFGPLAGLRGGNPLPLICVERTKDAVWLGFARQEAAVDRLLAAFAARFDAASTGVGESDLDVIMAKVKAFVPPLHDRQRDAVEMALRSRFTLLTGGPGTGKTTVVACMLWALLQADSQLHGESIVLCAPTGRAQARLAESVRANLLRLPGVAGTAQDSRMAGALQVKSATLHTLLGARPDGSFRHHAGHPLPHRVVVVDEASMIDLSLFASLVDAVAPDAHLVVVGDPDQLPSVDAGAVLADLVASKRCEGFRVGLTEVFRNGGEIGRRSKDFQDG